MQQIYRRTPMPNPSRHTTSVQRRRRRIDVLSTLKRRRVSTGILTLRHGCSPVNLQDIFRTPFTKNTSGWLLLFNETGVQRSSEKMSKISGKYTG